MIEVNVSDTAQKILNTLTSLDRLSSSSDEDMYKV